MINSHTSVTGLFGYPVRHSLSPLIHNYVYSKRKMNSVYLCFQIPPADLKKATSVLRTLDVRGINVTIPHKERIIKFLDGLDRTARIIGAVNTVKVSSNKLLGYNTDGMGFIRALKEHCSFRPAGKRVVICGCGGAGRAVSVALCLEKIKHLQIFDTDIARARSLALHLRKVLRVKADIARNLKELQLESCQLLVNATPVGLKGELLPLALKKVDRKCLVYDLVYGKTATPLVWKCKKMGLRAFTGLSMLVYQAAISQRVWFGNIKDTSGLMFRALKNEGYL